MTKIIIVISVALLLVGCDYSSVVDNISKPETKTNASDKNVAVHYMDIVDQEGRYHIGASGAQLRLVCNPNAHDPTWDEALKFVHTDNTDGYVYDLNTRVCGDFAAMLQNNAENAGIRCAFVIVSFANGTPSHSCNLFETSDKGDLFVDCTGGNYKEQHDDKIVHLKVGRPYIIDVIDYTFLTEYEKLDEKYTNLYYPYFNNVLSKEHALGPLAYKKLVEANAGAKKQIDELKPQLDKIKRDWGSIKTRSTSFNSYGVGSVYTNGYRYIPIGTVTNYEICWPK